MDLYTIESRLIDYGSGGYYLLETFVLKLLELEATSHSQALQIDSRNRDSYFDAYAPRGIGKINLPLAIDIKYQISPNTLRSLIDAHYKYKKDEKEGLLIITIRQLGKDSAYVNSIIKNSKTPIYIWDKNELQKLIDKHQLEAESLSENLFSARLKMAVSRSDDDWKTKREIITNKVSEKFRDGRLSLFLGAGVSSSVGLPNWDTLLNRLFVSMLTTGENKQNANENDNINNIVSRLRQIDGPSTLTLARYIRKGMSSGSGAERNRFIESVTEQLYGLRDNRFSVESSLIKEIVNLCTPTRTGAKIKGVINYNFDDLFERALENREINHRIIFEEEELAEPEELPVYHVHGFLPELRTPYTNLDRSTLVFSEEGYHQIYRDAYHWSNLIQLNSLKENSCLMIGLSLTDPNLRRLLEISTKSIDKPRHFAFLKRISHDEFSKGEKGTQIKAPIKMISDFLNRHHNLNEEVLRELGVSIIWYEDYEEIPGLLKNIRKNI